MHFYIDPNIFFADPIKLNINAVVVFKMEYRAISALIFTYWCHQELIILGCMISSWPRGYKTFSCSTQQSTIFQLLALSLSDVVFIMLIIINVKMSTIVGILTFMSSLS